MTIFRRQRCVGCGVTKVHSICNFYRCKTGKHGLRIKCKECVRQEVYDNRELKSLYYRVYDRRRCRRPERRALVHAWRQTPAGREAIRRSYRRSRRFKALEAAA